MIIRQRERKRSKIVAELGWTAGGRIIFMQIIVKVNTRHNFVGK